MMTPIELPELPIGMPLREHIVFVIGALAQTIDDGQRIARRYGDPDPSVVRLAKIVHEALNDIIEFTDREAAMRCGGDKLSMWVADQGKTAILQVQRDGESVSELAFGKDDIGSLIGLLKGTRKVMTQ